MVTDNILNTANIWLTKKQKRKNKMVTDNILNAVNEMVEMLETEEQKSAGRVIHEMLAEFDEDDWMDLVNSNSTCKWLEQFIPKPKTYEIRKADMDNLQSYSIWKHANEEIWEKCDENFFTGIDTLILVETRHIMEFDYKGKHFCLFDEPFSPSVVKKREPFRDMGICDVIYLRFSEEDFVSDAIQIKNN